MAAVRNGLLICSNFLLNSTKFATCEVSRNMFSNFFIYNIYFLM